MHAPKAAIFGGARSAYSFHLMEGEKQSWMPSLWSRPQKSLSKSAAHNHSFKADVLMLLFALSSNLAMNLLAFANNQMRAMRLLLMPCPDKRGCSYVVQSSCNCVHSQTYTRILCQQDTCLHMDAKSNGRHMLLRTGASLSYACAEACKHQHMHACIPKTKWLQGKETRALWQ